MSIGSWALLVFGFFAFLSFLGALADDGRIARPALRRLRPPTALGRVIVIVGGLVGLYVASYTGVLLAVTNRPIWSDTPLLGMLFVVSSASSSAALILLLAHRAGLAIPGLAALHRTDQWVIVLELLVLIALVVSLGPVAQAWVNAWGVLLLTVVIVGQIAPLVLSWRASRLRDGAVAAMAVLVLLGGLLLRFVIVFSSEAV
jgi:formate-dependent nitrite reductase membrane component NrfD